MNALRLRLLRSIRQLGQVGQVGAVLMVVALMVYLSMVWPAKTKSAQIAAQLIAEKDAQAAEKLHPAPASAGDNLHTFYDFFPARSKQAELVGQIYAAAHKEAIQLAEGEYKYSVGRAGKLGMYQVNFPVKGSYIQIRKFIAKVLNGMPTAALNELSFKRESIGGGEMEARIRFTIYMNDL